MKQLRNYRKKNIGSSEDPSLVTNVDELGLVYEGLRYASIDCVFVSKMLH